MTSDLAALGQPTTGLAALHARLDQDLAWLDLPKKAWLPERVCEGHTVLPVAIIGAGMAGMAAAAALNLIGVAAPMFDQSKPGLEGPWATTARMETLRSPKQLAGPSLGLPALTFRAWYEAQFGAAAWQVLDQIPRLQWMDYLRWYRQVLKLDVRNQHRVTALLPRPDGIVQLTISNACAINAGTEQTVLARRVVIATGRDGLGSTTVPAFVRALPRACWAHSADELDYRRLAGQRVAVIGAGASAMDCAATALEAGAASVELLIRRVDLPRINKGKGAGNPGFVAGYQHLPDPWKWRIRHYLNQQQTPPPHGSTVRVSRFDNARFNLACSVESAFYRNDRIELSTNQGEFQVDFLIAATGFVLDWSARPEWAAFAPHVRLWKHRFTAPAGQVDQELLDSPDLGSAFEFQEIVPGACPGLERIHCFCYPATLAHGTVTGDIPAISDGALRLSSMLASRLYHDDIEQHYANIQSFADPELIGNEWRPAGPRRET